MKTKQKHLFYTELAKLLEAGFGIRQAAAVMLDSGPPQAQACLLLGIEQGLASGHTITESFGGSAVGVSDIERSMLGAGERGGRLAAAMQHLADYFGMLAAVRADAVKRLIYPGFVLHLGVFVAVLPQPLMSGDAVPGSPGSRLLLALLVVYGTVLGLVMLVRVMLRAAQSRSELDRLLNLIPMVGKARNSLAMARFTKVYHMGLLAGLSMVETASTAAKAAHSGALDEAGLALAAAARAGQQFGPVMLAMPVIPKAFARSYATAEQAGTLDKDLERWSGVFQAEAARAAGTLVTAMATLLYAMILGFVAWGIWRFYSSYFDALMHIGGG